MEVLNGQYRRTVDEAAWFDIQVRCLEQLRLLLEHCRPETVPDGGTLSVHAQQLITVLLQSMDRRG